MTHDATGPTVSLSEAKRLEKETSERLLKSRKLSLIVDLDQTIVHATVDPTVGEWMDEGEAYEAKRKSAGKGAGDDADDDDVNPNWEALRDVKKFKLGHEGSTGKNSVHIADDGCFYYIKPRYVAIAIAVLRIVR
jgi:RNA polymerase II subunit A C-terminal domain phosphatase